MANEWNDLKTISYEDVIKSNYTDMTPEKIKCLVNGYIDNCLHKIHRDIITISSIINIFDLANIIEPTDTEKVYYRRNIIASRRRLKSEVIKSQNKEGIWKDLDFNIESLNDTVYSFDEILNREI